MRVGIAPAGTDPSNKGAWLYVNVENIRVEHDEPQVWHSIDGNTRIRPTPPRTTHLILANGKEIKVPQGMAYRIVRQPPPRLWAEPATAACEAPAIDYQKSRARSQAIINELYHAFPAFPQRFIAGISSEEDKPLTLAPSYFSGLGGASVKLSHPAPNHSVVTTTGIPGTTAASALVGESDHSFAALQLLRNINRAHDITTETLDGRTTIAVGAAKVYRAESEDEAKRNLDFAVANLKSYLYWITDGIKAKAKRDADLKAAEARAAKEQAEREAKVKEARRIDGLALKLYNASLGKLPSTPWPFMMGYNQKLKWLDLAKQADVISKPLPQPVISPIYPDFKKLADDMNRAFSTRPRPFGY